jgi:outer membrane protein assembly factor BamC
MLQVKSVFASTPVRGAVLALGLALAGCSALENSLGGDKIDYRNGGARKTNPLEVPPDLTPLARDGRYVPQAGVISASTVNQPGVTASSSTPSVAVKQVGDLRIERAGSQRWLVSNRSPEQLWPQVREFWLSAGFNLEVDNAQAGLLETNWAENRAKLPQDLIRSTLGSIVDGLYSTGQRDKYRTRLERGPNGTEIYVTHLGLEEVYTGKDRDSGTAWAAAPADPALETEMLTRMMVSLGATKDDAKTAMAASTAPGAAGPAAKARVIAGQPAATLQLDDNAERAWRRVGLALDRSGFTVEDRDRVQGTYNVRYVDPKEAAKEAGFFSKLFGGKDPAADALSRYRIQVKPDGNLTVLTVLTLSGQPDNSANAQRIVAVLAEELKF